MTPLQLGLALLSAAAVCGAVATACGLQAAWGYLRPSAAPRRIHGAPRAVREAYARVGHGGRLYTAPSDMAWGEGLMWEMAAWRAEVAAGVTRASLPPVSPGREGFEPKAPAESEAPAPETWRSGDGQP